MVCATGRVGRTVTGHALAGEAQDEQMAVVAARRRGKVGAVEPMAQLVHAVEAHELQFLNCVHEPRSEHTS